MSDPKLDRDDHDSESMFDFLEEEGREKSRRKQRAADVPERALPIIRKPVPVSESGPLLPPKPGAPVEPPPKLINGTTKIDDDLDFLNDMSETYADGQSRRKRPFRSDSDSNITRLDPRSRPTREGQDHRVGSGPSRGGKVPDLRYDDFDRLELDLGDTPELTRDRNRERIVAGDDLYDDKAPRGRRRWLLLALVLIAVGAGSFLFANPVDWRELVQKLGIDPGSPTLTDKPSPADPVEVPEELEGEVAPTVSPLMQRFLEQLSLVEGLVADGALDDAESALARMDRTVYGYGAAEFGDLQARIEQMRSGMSAADPAAEQVERDAAERIAADQAAQAENERQVAAEQEARDLEARVAAEQAARDEQSRIDAEERAAGAEQVEREEQARRNAQVVLDEQAAEAQAAEAAQVERVRQAAAEKAARDEQARIAAQQEERARVASQNDQQEAARVEQARQAAQTARTSDWQSVQADRQATDRRIAEERAALQRQQARDQRLVEAREREAALAAQAASQISGDIAAVDVPDERVSASRSTTNPAANAPAEETKVASGPRAIGDDELQTVYRRFIDLQQAVSSRDINAVVGLTQRSGARVQQLMQIFENSTQIDARIRNVSTSNATGQIKGTLQINRIKRADGTFIEPPAALSSISLSSEREGDGWSAISW